MKAKGERGSQVCKEVSRVTRLSIHMVEANIPITIKDFFDGLQKWTGSIRSYHFVWDKLCHTNRFLIPSLQARSKPWYKAQSAARGIEHIPIFIQKPPHHRPWASLIKPSASAIPKLLRDPSVLSLNPSDAGWRYILIISPCSSFSRVLLENLFVDLIVVRDFS